MTKKWPKKITSVEAGGGQRAPAVWSVAGAGGVEAGGGRPGLPGWRASGTRPAAGPRLGKPMGTRQTYGYTANTRFPVVYQPHII